MKFGRIEFALVFSNTHTRTRSVCFCVCVYVRVKQLHEELHNQLAKLVNTQFIKMNAKQSKSGLPCTEINKFDKRTTASGKVELSITGDKECDSIITV